MVKPYDGDIPDYQVSLKDAVDKLKKGLSADDSKWAEKSRACLSSLEKIIFQKTPANLPNQKVREVNEFTNFGCLRIFHIGSIFFKRVNS